MTNPFANAAKIALAASVLGFAGTRVIPVAAQTVSDAATKPTIILVHGAFADVSSWNGEITLLQNDGYRVIAPANELRGIANDAKSVPACSRASKARSSWSATRMAARSSKAPRKAIRTLKR
jgi:pimeloyl-ACP methyl ester carboxylesterase